jgi:hypothetical protein
MIKDSHHSKETLVKMSQIKIGKNIKDIARKRFGKLVVISIVESPKYITGRAKYWLCKCDCGRTKNISGTLLRNGHSKSCGCGNIATRFKRNGRTEINILYYGYKRSAEERNLVFDIDMELFSKLVKDKCFYCNNSPVQTLDYYKWTQGFTYNGIDRVDSSNGYTPNNCVSCCSKCNYAKRSMSSKDFYKWIKDIYNNLKLKGEIK